jgi:hypothetical protein
MTKNSTFALDPKFNGTLREYLRHVEGAKKGNSNVSIVKSGESGLTVGEIQMDLSKKKDLAADILRVGKAKNVEGSNQITLEMLQKKHDSGMSDTDKARIVKFTQDTLATREGKEVLDKAERTQLKEVEAAVARICEKPDPRAADMCGTLEGQLRFAGYAHQFGTDVGELTKVVQGGTGNIGKTDKNPKGFDVKLDGEMTPEWFDKNYVGQTKFGQENRPAVDSRIERANNFDYGSPTPAPAPQPEPAKDETAQPTPHSSLPSDSETRPVAAEPPPPRKPVNLLEMPSATDPTLARFVATSSTQDPGQYGVTPLMPDDRRKGMPPYDYEPVPQPPADPYNLKGLLAALTGQPTANPIGDLLGRGAKRTDPKSAVKLFQSTINNFNRPENFDWNWSTNGKIDVDGELGPQTMAGFGRAVEKAGPEGFARKFAVDQFRQYATRLDNGIERYENLPGALDSSIGRLDRNAAASFQDYLNVARENLAPHVRYPALKRDGWVGPKTTDAFKTALYSMGPKNIADDLEGIFGV